MRPAGKIVLATGNAGKVRELDAMLKGSGLNVVPQGDYACPEIAETGLTFVENALIKARHAARHTKLPAIADDSGLAVDVLHGAPGIYSSRYAGPGASDATNIGQLLAALEGFPTERRTGRFICVLVYLEHADDPTPLIAEGRWEGRITFSPRGDRGFGYDPVFEIPSLGLTAAELDGEQKHALSHRGQALRALAARLLNVARA